MKILLIQAPMTQLNTPYPALPYLSGWLRAQNYDAAQKDFSLELALALFSRSGLERIEKKADQVKRTQRSASVKSFLDQASDYFDSIEPVIRFLQGKDSSFALRIATRNLLPEGPRFLPLDEYPELVDNFGSLGVQDLAKYFASLFLDDIADAIRDGVDSRFEFSRYGERLAASQASFNLLKENLEAAPTVVDEMLEEITKRHLASEKPDVVGISAPFAGNVYASLRIGKTIKAISPQTRILLGGGYVNTELRELTDPRIFEYVDYLTFDDGEGPFLALLEYFSGKRSKKDLFRIKLREQNQVVDLTNQSSKDPPFKSLPCPSTIGLPLTEYISLLELPNPMHRLWSDFRWNKMILAHGCYWRKCSFCDVNLDYIRRFEPADADRIVHQMEQMARDSGSSGFHFVDEAAPPALLRAVSERIISRGIKLAWWGNLRFDRQFTPALASLMAEAGCIAVSGGLEVASPRVLNLINKGLNVEQVASVTRAFSDAGIYVHAYLMYGFPTQTVQETIDSLEVVRQLFANDCIQSAFWHRFAATTHSPVGRDPKKFGIELLPIATPKEGLFARNDVPFIDPKGCDHESLSAGLKKALYNYMHGNGIDSDVREWFEFSVPKAKVKRSFIKAALANAAKGHSQK